MLDDERCLEQHESTSDQSVLSVPRICEEHGPYIAFSSSGGYSACSRCACSTELFAGRCSTEAMLRRAGVPESLLSASFETFRQSIPRQVMTLGYVRTLAERWANGDFEECSQLVLLGRRSAGKTHIALSMVRHLAKNAVPFYVDASLGLPAIPKNVDLLVVDHLLYHGAATDPFMQSDLNAILCERAMRKQATIVVSDQDKSVFSRAIGTRTLYWMRRNGAHVVNFDWEVETYFV